MLLQVARRLSQVDVALLVCAASTEASTDESRPSSATEKNDGEDDTETEADGGLNQEVGKASIPLAHRVSSHNMNAEFAIVDLRKSNLLVEERFAHGSGNGARRSFGGSSGLGHGDML